MGVNAILDTAKQALFAQQRALQVVGQNIANVNTPGYSRQRPEFLATGPTRNGLPYYGVKVDEVTRTFDRFINGQVNTATARFSSTQTQADFLRQVETLFNDVSQAETGLAAGLERFFDTFQELANNPSGLAERTTVQTQGQTVVDQFHHLAGQLDELGHHLNTVLEDELAEVNRLTKQIAELNVSIQDLEVNPNTHANTLRDERDLALKQLSEKVSVTSFETNNGVLTVLLGGGRPLVEGNKANTLVAVSNPDDLLHPTVQVQDGQGNRFEAAANITGGKVHGLLEVRDTFLPRFVSNLDRLAAQFVGSVNELHSNGYGLDGSTGYVFFTPRQVTAQAGADNTGDGTLQATVFDSTQLTLDEYSITFDNPPTTFDVVNTTTGATLASNQTYTSGATIRFDGLAVVISDGPTAAPQQGDTFTISTTKGAASTIAVDAGILQDTNTIAAGQQPESGDNANALALANLKEASLLEGATLSEFYHALVGNVGLESQKSSTLADHQQLLLTEAENQRESLAGVSLDEEQVDLIRFQQAFSSAAQLIRIADELADEVINLVR